MKSASAFIRQKALPLESPADLDPLLERICMVKLTASRVHFWDKEEEGEYKS